MSGFSILLIKIVAAAINGILFALGMYLFLEFMVFRPRRMRKRLARLIVESHRLEMELDDSPRHSDLENTTESPELGKMRSEINHLRTDLQEWNKNPKNLLNASFGAIMIAISVFALMNLLFPVFSIFQ